jgi:hypothetical protein
MRIGHVLDGEFRLVAGQNLNGADAEDAVDEALRDIDGPNMPEIHREAVLAQDALLIHELVFGDDQRRRPGLDVPIEQNDDAHAERGDQNDRECGPEGVGAEHRRMRFIDDCFRHPPTPPLVCRSRTLFPRP